MARVSKVEKLRQLHAKSIAEFDEVAATAYDERKQSLEDRRFYSISGAMWEGSLGIQFEEKFRFEVNKIHLAVIRIINESRNNRISVTFASKEGKDEDKLADACTSLYRADEQDSCAEEAEDNAFEESVGGGMGGWRLRTEYEDEDDDDNTCQRIRFEPIMDADSTVYFNAGSKRQDKSDAKRCWVISSLTHADYEEEWGPIDSSWAKPHGSFFDWFTPDYVYIAEYYEIEKTKDTKYTYTGSQGEEVIVMQSELDAEAEEQAEEDKDEVSSNSDEEDKEYDTITILKATGFKLTKTKTITRQRVHKYILSGSKVLEDCGYIAGKYIPIIVTFGKRWFVDGIERFMGHVRLAKDVSRLKNMQISKMAEIAAMSSVEKPVFTPEQIAGHTQMWAEDNIKNWPYLLINQTYDANGQPMPPQAVDYTRSPQIPPAMAQLIQITEQDIKDVLGNQQAGEELQANTSFKAVELVQNKLDMQTFIYVSNMSKAKQWCGKVWLSMAKEVYVEEGRKMKGVEQSGDSRTIELFKPTLDENGVAVKENILGNANFDVVSTVGPSSASKREATVRALTGMMSITQDPETLQVLGAMSMMNMEGEGIEEVRDFFRHKLLKMGAVKPTDQEKKDLADEDANTPPDPNTEFLHASAKQAEAEAGKAEADTILSAAKAEESKAKAAEIISSLKVDQQDHLLNVLKSLHEMRTSGEMPSSQK